MRYALCLLFLVVACGDTDRNHESHAEMAWGPAGRTLFREDVIGDWFVCSDSFCEKLRSGMRFAPDGLATEIDSGICFNPSREPILWEVEGNLLRFPQENEVYSLRINGDLALLRADRGTQILLRVGDGRSSMSVCGQIGGRFFPQ